MEAGRDFATFWDAARRRAMEHIAKGLPEIRRWRFRFELVDQAYHPSQHEDEAAEHAGFFDALSGYINAAERVVVFKIVGGAGPESFATEEDVEAMNQANACGEDHPEVTAARWILETWDAAIFPSLQWV